MAITTRTLTIDPPGQTISFDPTGASVKNTSSVALLVDGVSLAAGATRTIPAGTSIATVDVVDRTVSNTVQISASGTAQAGPLQKVLADTLYTTKAESQLQVVANRSRMIAASPKSNGTNTQCNSQAKYTIRRASRSLRVRYANVVSPASGTFGEKDTSVAPTPYTISGAAVWLLRGTYTIGGTITTTGATLTYASGEAISTNSLLGCTLVDETGKLTAVVTSITSAGVIVNSAWLSDTGTTGTSPATSRTIKAYDVIPLTFGGSTTVTLAANAVVDSDDTGIVLKGDDTDIWVRTYATATAGNYWPGSDYGTGGTTGLSLNNEWTETGTTLTDKSTSGWPTTVAASAIAVTPQCVLGVPFDATRPAVLLDGDSRVYGAQDTFDGTFNKGVAQRVCERFSLPWFNGGVPGETTISGALPAARNPQRMKIAPLCRWAWYGKGINDARNGIPLARTQERILADLAYLVGQGLRVVVECPMPDLAATTDGCITTTNQTISTTHAARIAICQWMRDTSSSGMVAQAYSTYGVPPSSIYVWDASSVIETSQDSGVLLPALKLFDVVIDTASAGTAFFLVNQPVANFASIQNVAVQAVVPSGGVCVFGNSYQGSNKNAVVQNAINSSGKTRFNFAVNFSTPPNVGDTIGIYEVLFGNQTAADLVHYGGAGVTRQVNAFPTGILS